MNFIHCKNLYVPPSHLRPSYRQPILSLTFSWHVSLSFLVLVFPWPLARHVYGEVAEDLKPQLRLAAVSALQLLLTERKAV